MVISQELQQLYASSDTGAEEAVTISLSHPAFSKDYHFTDAPRSFIGRLSDNSTNVTFEPNGFRVVHPTEDAGGASQFKLAIGMTGATEWTEIKAAIEYRYTNGPAPISVTVGSYLIHGGAPKINGGFILAIDPPFTLSLGELQVDDSTIVGVAEGVDVLNLAFPRLFYEPSKFPGLVRG